MGKDVIVACDFASGAETLAFLGQFEGRKPFVKIGMELFYAEGPQIVRQIKARGHRIFLDLKLHDIPNTVKKAMRSLSALDVDIVNLHAAGTRAMMEAALEGAKARLGRAQGVMEALSPLAVLGRGYTMTLGEDGRVVRSAAGVGAGTVLTTRWADGTATSVVRGPQKLTEA